MLAALHPAVSVLSAVALLRAFCIQLLVAELVRPRRLCSPDVLTLVVPGLALAVVAAALILITRISILLVKIRGALAGVSSAVLGDVTAVHSVPTVVASRLKKAGGAVTAGPVAAVSPVGERALLTAQPVALHMEATVTLLPSFHISIPTFRGLKELCWPVEKAGATPSLQEVSVLENAAL